MRSRLAGKLSSVACPRFHALLLNPTLIPWLPSSRSAGLLPWRCTISSPLTGNKERFMSEEKVVTYELEGDIALIGLNRPDKRNALSPDLMRELRDAALRAGD